jgi:uncharacterized membrane protein YfcA
LAFLALVVALLYSSVGHGGASGYLAAMALVGLAPEEMKPTALLLNVLVSAVGSVRFIRAGYFNFRLFLLFAVSSIPFALFGGMTGTSDDVYRKLLGIALCLAAAMLALPRPEVTSKRAVNWSLAIALGAAIGYVSGLIGIGGGVFLSPLLILLGWATTRETLGISALFILVNSVAGLAGHLAALPQLSSSTPWLAAAAFVGGLIGSGLAAKKLVPQAIRLLLVVVLVLAAGKLLLT